MTVVASRFDRRGFLKSTVQSALAGGSLVGLGDVGFLSKLRPLRAEETALDPKIVRLRPEIEPLVRFLEETPRERLLEEIALRIKKGTTYRQILASLLLAGVRNVQPRPRVGFKFHAVLVVNSAHLASLSSPDAHRWLPIFWALDYFKSSQADDVREGNWTMAPVDESSVPAAHGAVEAFRKAMDGWDEAAADVSVSSLARHYGAQRVFEEFFRYGARDYRSIGHKAIYVANSWRTLACIGWQHAEPVLRSLAYALLNHEKGNPADRDAEADRPWRNNLKLVEDVCVHCQDGKIDAGASSRILEVARGGTYEDAARAVVDTLRKGVSPQSVWDGLFEGVSELIVRRPGLISLHAATTLNALRFMYQTSGVPETRAMLLLQAASFLPMFRKTAGLEAVGVADLEAIEPLRTEAKGAAAVEEIFAELGEDKTRAMRKTLHYLSSGNDARELIDAARLLIFLKGTNAHDYKFSSAVLEDYYHISPKLRDRFLAGSMHLLRSSKAKDNRLVERTREALS